MTNLRRICSDEQNHFVHVVEMADGSFRLQRFVRKFDPEEDQEYIVRELPDPPGIFLDLKMAIAEANRILGIHMWP